MRRLTGPRAFELGRMRSSQLVEFASASRRLRPPAGPGSVRRYARCLLALAAHGRRRRRPCARRAGRRRAAPECRVDREGEAAVSPLLAHERRRDRSCPGVSGSSPHFSSGRPEPGLRGTRSGSALSWWRGRAWWSARSRISGALAVAERIGLSRSEEEGTCRSAVGHAPPAPAPRPRARGCARSGAWKRRPASAPGPSATADRGR